VKVAYEYANRLAARGHVVTVVHAPITRVDPSFVMLAKAVLRFPQRCVDRSYRPDKWLDVERAVRVKWVPSYAERFIPDADAVVATAWKTAEWVARYGLTKGEKFYLIQHYEAWDATQARVDATWTAPLRKIVIAKWLAEIANRLGQDAAYVPNGLDFSKFGIDIPIAARPRSTALMLFHEMNWKGSADGLAAARLVHEALPEFRLVLFGVGPPPHAMPDWAVYHRNPPQRMLRRLYNEASVFIAPSWAEGWPLPPAEAMMSGLALACTDIGGHREYAEHGRTALLSLPRDAEALAANIARLCQDDALRIRIAEQGHHYIQQFTWERAVERLEGVMSVAYVGPMATSVGDPTAPVGPHGLPISNVRAQ
jgi:glycosyltransferase involved in cell wall biosynthesis